MLDLPQADVPDRGNHLRVHEGTSDHLVPAMYHLTQSKHGMSSIELGRRLGVTQTTAWKMKTKLAEVMRRSSDKDRLQGRIEMDDAYLGGERSGGKTGRGSLARRPLLPPSRPRTTASPSGSRSDALPGSSVNE